MRLKSRRVGFIGIGVLVLLVAAGVLVVQQRAGRPADALAAADSTATEDKDEDKKDVRVPVELYAASRRDLPAYFNATGSLEARRLVELISKAQGQVMKLSVEEGQTVRTGDVVLELEHREEELLLDQAEVRKNTTARELVRIRGLLDKGLGSERDFETAQQEAEVAAIERDLAQVRLDNRIIRAPFNGQVTQRHVELGQTVNVGQPLVALADTSPLEVRLHLPEQVVKDLNVGQPVEIRPDIAHDRPLAGRVERIAPAVDPATSTVKVTLKVADSGDQARVGSFVRARVTTDVHKDALAIPKKAMVPEAGATFLFVAEADTVRKVPVETGYSDDEFIEILAGLAEGDTVVTVGQGGLRHGSKIRDLAAPAAATEPEVASADGAVDSSDAGER
jgi:membrane fusion protein (multidrug efflux system)